MNSYKATEKIEHEQFYKVSTLDGYDQASFGLMVGALFYVPYVLFIIFSGFVTENYNRRNLIAFICFS
jgi:hypothetical protein